MQHLIFGTAQTNSGLTLSTRLSPPSPARGVSLCLTNNPKLETVLSLVPVFCCHCSLSRLVMVPVQQRTCTEQFKKNKNKTDLNGLKIGLEALPTQCLKGKKSPKPKYISWLNTAPLKCNTSFHSH